MGKEKLNSNSKIIYRNDTLPTFPDGMKEFYKFVKDNFNIPSELKKEGKIYTLFTVETDGSLTDIKILRDLGFGTGKETIRVLNKSPKWIPGKNKTEPIRMQFTLPIPIHPQ
jgi:protein TonB